MNDAWRRDGIRGKRGEGREQKVEREERRAVRRP